MRIRLEDATPEWLLAHRARYNLISDGMSCEAYRRFIADALGLTVHWDFSIGETYVRVQIPEHEMTTTDILTILSAEITTAEGRVYRFQSMGAIINCDEVAVTEITYKVA